MLKLLTSVKTIFPVPPQDIIFLIFNPMQDDSQAENNKGLSYSYDMKNSSIVMSGDIEQLVNCLKELQTAKYNTRTNVLASCAQTDRVLELIYDLGTEKTKISNENKAVIGPLLENSLKYIEIDIKRVAIKYRRRLDTEVLRKRSALQFLIDDFGDYPTKTPGKTFSGFFSDIKELTEILDDLISKWKGRKDPEDPDSDRDEAEDLPASHTWWKD